MLFFNCLFGQVLTPFLVELSTAVERAGEPLMLSICAHAIVMGSERPTINACPSQLLLAQCREIVDTANAMDGSIGARWVHVGELRRYKFRLTPSTSEADTRPRPTKYTMLSKYAKIVAMLVLSPENGF